MGFARTVSVAAASALLLVGGPKQAAAVVPPPSKVFVPPRWPPTYQLNLSTIAMPCNDSGYYTNTERMFQHWGVLSWDWSNAKASWVNEKPMDSEDSLITQVSRIKAAANHRGQRHLVYRNTVHAMPWFRSVREKLADPAYAGFFLKFAGNTSSASASTSAGTSGNAAAGKSNGASLGYYSPPCDETYNPPRCSALYHDQTQTPATDPAKADGLCTPGLCDCGGDDIPCGMYLFNHLNGSMFAQWFLEEYVGGTASGLGNPDVSGFFFDDFWCWDNGTPGQCMFAGKIPMVGPAETEHHVLQDLGMNASTVKLMAEAWRANMDRVYTKVESSRAMSWDLAFPNSYNNPRAGAATVPRPTIILPEQCEAILERECGDGGGGGGGGSSSSSVPPPTGDQGGGYAVGDQSECCCATARCPGVCPAHCPLMRDQPLFFGLNYTSKDALSDPDVNARYPRLAEDVAQFLLVRGEYAWLGLGFVSCHPDTNYTLPSAVFEKDYGVPKGTCTAVRTGGAGGEGVGWGGTKRGVVFRREYTKATVEVDCTRGTANIQFLG